MKRLASLAAASLLSATSYADEPGWNGVPFGSPRAEVEKRFPEATWSADDQAFRIKDYQLHTGTALDSLKWSVILRFKDERFAGSILQYVAGQPDTYLKDIDALRAALIKVYGSPFKEDGEGKVHRATWRKERLLVTMALDARSPLEPSIYLIYDTPPTGL